MSRILFILKRREDFDPSQTTPVGMQTGLYNAAKFMCDSLNENHIPAKIAVVTDTNSIDYEVDLFKPTHVIIEAFWVVPTKFDILSKLHPKIKWIVRAHSELPFLAMEGITAKWLAGYTEHKNVLIAANAPRMMGEIKTYLKAVAGWNDEEANKRIIYLPNCYPKQYAPFIERPRDPEFVNVGCFGAVRPLKNHPVQAMAALKFATKIGKRLRFHINGHVETKGDAVLNFIRDVFKYVGCRGHQLRFHPWVARDEFLNSCAKMDIGMQVSFSETFNIVGADFISQSVPLVSSKELPWAAPNWTPEVTDSDEIAEIVERAYYNPRKNVEEHQSRLTKYSEESTRIWCEYFS